MINTVLHKAETRGHANHGWLDAHHSFSFANYYDPQRIHFGVLRVLNDDAIAGGKGFGMHPHDNMEIITIPLEGALEHKDSMGNSAVIKKGDVQIMSAGTGIFHSEFNPNKDKAVKLLQIWVLPNKKDAEPRYDQIALDENKMNNSLQQIISPDKNQNESWIHQDAWFNLGRFDKDFSAEYSVKKSGNGVYVFVINGEVQINAQVVRERDGFGIWNTDKFSIKAKTDNTEILLMDVPM